MADVCELNLKAPTHCIMLGANAGRHLYKGDYQFRITIGDDNIIGTTMTPAEYKVLHAVVKRCVEKGMK